MKISIKVRHLHFAANTDNANCHYFCFPCTNIVGEPGGNANTQTDIALCTVLIKARDTPFVCGTSVSAA